MQLELVFDRGTLVLRGRPDARAAAGFTYDGRTDEWRCSAHLYAPTARRLQQLLGDRFRDRVPRPEAVRFPKAELVELRDDQREAVEAWESAGGRGVVVMPTGTGKTEVALAAMARHGLATLIVAPIRDLMHQWHRRIERAFGCEAGILGDGQRDIRPVTVTTYDSAYIHMEAIGDRFGLIVFDEAHHLPGPNMRQAAEFCAAATRMGLTATLERPDGLHEVLDGLIGPVAYRQEISQARGRTLADYETIRIPVHLTSDEQSRYNEACRVVRAFVIDRSREKPGYKWQDVCAESGKDPAARRAMKAYRFKTGIEDRAEEKLRVLEDIFRLHAHERVLVFAGSNAMATDISRRFLVPLLLHHSDRAERRAVLDGFQQGKYQAIVANQVLDEGVDVPAVKVAAVVGGFGSERQAKQRLGRILRRTGAARAVLYEIVCQDTREEKKSRKRRRSDAYQGTRHLRSERLHG